MTVIGIISPGLIGSQVARSLMSDSNDVIWASEGRSDKTKEFASAVEVEGAKPFKDVGDMATLVEKSDVIVSVCSHEAVWQIAETVANFQFKGIFVDANWVVPLTESAYDELLDKNFPDWVQGGVHADDDGNLFFLLKGKRAQEVFDLFNTWPTYAPKILDSPKGVRAFKREIDERRNREGWVHENRNSSSR